MADGYAVKLGSPTTKGTASRTLGECGAIMRRSAPPQDAQQAVAKRTTMALETGRQSRSEAGRSRAGGAALANWRESNVILRSRFWRVGSG